MKKCRALLELYWFTDEERIRPKSTVAVTCLQPMSILLYILQFDLNSNTVAGTSNRSFRKICLSDYEL